MMPADYHVHEPDREPHREYDDVAEYAPRRSSAAKTVVVVLLTVAAVLAVLIWLTTL